MPDGFDPILLDRIRQATPLASLIGQDVPLQRTGHGFTGCCPFHDEKTPSFHVYEDHYHCFSSSCGAHGDAISYVQEKHGHSFPEAVRALAQQAGIEVPGRNAKPLTAEEKADRERQLAERAEAQARQREAEQSQRQADHEAIRNLADWIWEKKSKPADPDHPYLARKQISGEGLRQDERGNLLIPLRDEKGVIWNLEKILPERPGPDRNDKYSLSKKDNDRRISGRIEGLFTTFGDPDQPGPLVIASGVATAWSVHAGTGFTTFRAGSDANLMPVALKIRELYPDRDIIIAGDNDHKHEGKLDARGQMKVNGGKMQAEEVAQAVGGIAVLPPFPKGDSGSDFNDFSLAHGLDATKELFAQAIKQGTMMSETQAHAWDEVLTRLRESLDHPELKEIRPRIEKLLDEPKLDDPWFRTRTAYVIADIDRILPQPVALPPAIRSEVDQLAISSPGLTHPRLIETLRLTGELGRDDLPLIQEVRNQARLFVKQEADAATMERLESAVTSKLAGPEAPPHTAIPPNLTGDPEQPAATKPDTQQARQPEQQQTRADPEAKQAKPSQEQPQATQAHSVQQPAASSWASKLVDAVAPRPSSSPPPWEGIRQALSGRMAAYQEAQADRVSTTLHQRAQSAAEVAIEALRKIETGPAADLLRRVHEEAANDPKGMAGVIANMRPGGTHENLRNEMNTLFVENKGFANAYERAKAAVAGYFISRQELAKEYGRRGWNPADLDSKLQDFDQAVVERAEKVPARQSGRALIEDLAERAMQMARDVIEHVKQAFSRKEPASAAKTPELSPTI